jgi:hypothetical protein
MQPDAALMGPPIGRLVLTKQKTLALKRPHKAEPFKKKETKTPIQHCSRTETIQNKQQQISTALLENRNVRRNNYETVPEVA